MHLYLSDSKLLILLRDSQPEIELIDIFEREFSCENVIDLRLLQLINAYSEIVLTLDGIVILYNELLGGKQCQSCSKPNLFT